MPKKKRFTPGKNKKSDVGLHESALGSDDETLYTDVGKPNFKSTNSKDVSHLMSSDEDEVGAIYGRDEIDQFHKEREKKLQTGVMSEDDDEDNYISEEEVLPFSEDESEDENDEFAEYYLRQKHKDDMASDLEDEDAVDEESFLPDVHAWGKKKSIYYNTDFVDKDFRKAKQEDLEEAQYEEEEAIAAQKRLYDQINDDDLGLNLFEPDGEGLSTTEKNQKYAENVEVDISSLSKRQKMSLLTKDSPELLPLISDCLKYMNELKDRLEPVRTLVKTSGFAYLSKLSGFEFIETKYHLILRFAININFYLMLKSKREPVKDHPVIKQLLKYKNLIMEMEKMSEASGIEKDIDLILKNINEPEKISFVKLPNISNGISKRKNEFDIASRTKRVKFADEGVSCVENDNEKDEGTGNGEEYNEYEEDADGQRRGITYQMAKNKGLTPKRRKELRNPRVKHRMKYKKAKVRRKGQVREPRKEIKKYSGEISGIRSSVVRSIKFK